MTNQYRKFKTPGNLVPTGYQPLPTSRDRRAADADAKRGPGRTMMLPTKYVYVDERPFRFDGRPFTRLPIQPYVHWRTFVRALGLPEPGWENDCSRN